ncbi:uncharacterized protein LOC110114994 isoform X1 [Dendrobium catenatum]|uniref:uncharacterized protein LOC110114994 isoform X1 n=1 Tax=Dendrobium catenatum TaxID=906689 RepID=UPI00109FA569|nr:uncharacterized protein LOC110114994 isoform X1 [Dendrobium catenatum]
MLENNSENLKRFGPPPQRNRSLNRRKSGDRFEKVNYSYGIDGDKSQSSVARNFSSVDHGDTGSSYIQNESIHIGLVALDGCSTSDAAQLLNERWAATMHSYNDQSVDLSGFYDNSFCFHFWHWSFVIIQTVWVCYLFLQEANNVHRSQRGNLGTSEATSPDGFRC